MKTLGEQNTKRPLVGHHPADDSPIKLMSSKQKLVLNNVANEARPVAAKQAAVELQKSAAEQKQSKKSQAPPAEVAARPRGAPRSPSPQPQPAQQPAQAQQREELGVIKKFSIDCLMYLIKGVIATYDLISQPAFYFKHEVRRRRQSVERVRSAKIRPDDPDSPWRQIDIEPRHLELERRIDSFETYDEMMRQSFADNADSPCFGYRQIVEETWVKRPDTGKQLRQVKLTPYKWLSYAQFERAIEAARKGLLLEGIRPEDKVMLFADTRPEWQVVSQALVRMGAVVCTMYSTLGVDGILHTVNETQATHVITQRDKVNRLLNLREKLPRLAKIIYFERSLYLPRALDSSESAEGDEQMLAGRRQQADKDRRDFGCDPADERRIECKCFMEVLERGLAVSDAELERELQASGRPYDASLVEKRRKDSLAVIMYTSGSTGIPKGVLISHGNIMATVKSFSYVTKDFVHNAKENVCTAYLPLAHIFEFCIESVMLFHGVSYGFATPHTLTDKSPGLVPGQTGDLVALRPTVMIIVPLILDRVVQGIKQTLRAGPYFKEQLVDYLINYKIYWQRRHYDTPLVDKIVCKKIALALGGRAKWVICGSAPLSAQTQMFVRAAFDMRLPQGFGTTETCAATACQLFDDQSTQNVGLPVAGAQIKLEAWEEGNYRPSDQPNPRGEIVVGGQMVAHGYFNLDEQTKEAFYVDEQGTRWYRTGDIGEFLPNGQLKIIDRKKDLVKLQNGEYISLGRVESTLKSNPYTENFCVYADSNYNYVVALGPANEQALKGLAKQLVEEHERRLSPSVARRLAAEKQQLDVNSNQVGAHEQEEREALLLSDDERQSAVDELAELLAEYAEEEAEEQARGRQTEDRKMSALSTLSVEPSQRLVRLCSNKLIKSRVLAFVCNLARERNLMSLEIPKKLLLLPDEWTEDKNLVTAAMKIRRNFIYKRYEKQLRELYSEEAR